MREEKRSVGRDARGEPEGASCAAALGAGHLSNGLLISFAL